MCARRFVRRLSGRVRWASANEKGRARSPAVLSRAGLLARAGGLLFGKPASEAGRWRVAVIAPTSPTNLNLQRSRTAARTHVPSVEHLHTATLQRGTAARHRDPSHTLFGTTCAPGHACAYFLHLRLLTSRRNRCFRTVLTSCQIPSASAVRRAPAHQRPPPLDST